MRLGTQPGQRLTLAVACAAQVMMVLDVLIVSVACRLCSANFTSRLPVWNGW